MTERKYNSPDARVELLAAHEGKPAWLAGFARYALQRIGNRRGVSLNNAKRWLGANSPTILWSSDMRRSLDDLQPHGLGISPGSPCRIRVSRELAAFWREILVPGFQAEPSTLSAYWIRCLSLPLTAMSRYVALRMALENSSTRMPANCRRLILLRRLFTSPALMAAHCLDVAQKFSLPHPGCFPWPQRFIDALLPGQALVYADNLALHPCYENTNGYMRLSWRQAAPKPLRYTSPYTPVPLSQCLKKYLEEELAAGTTHWRQRSQNNNRTLAERAKEAALALPDLAALLQWWTEASPDAMLDIPQNYTLYADRSGERHPLLLAGDVPGVVMKGVELCALQKGEGGYGVTRLGSVTVSGKKALLFFVKTRWGRTIQRLILDLDAGWPVHALQLLGHIGQVRKESVIVTPQSLAVSKMTPEAALHILGLFIPLKKWHVKTIRSWRQKDGSITPSKSQKWPDNA
jgi:hypothetical protein